MYLCDNMSDEDRDIDIESDEDDDDGSIGTSAGLSDPTTFMTQAEKRAHHNALERKRRDHIKDSFHSLRDSVPALHGEKVNKVSRAQILKKAADYIQFMRKKNHNHQVNIDELKKQNSILEQQIRGLEKARTTGQFASQTSSVVNAKGGTVSAFDGGSGSESSNEEEPGASRRKKLKVAE